MGGGPATSGAAAHVLVDTLADDLRVDGTDGHHLARVRRLRVGERVTAADGEGRWRGYTVATVEDRGLVLRATGDIETEARSGPALAVAFALTKGAKPEVVVRQLTEVGVDAILPVVAARSVARPATGNAEAFALRLRRVARAAAMQSRRSWLPEVRAPRPLAELAGCPGLVVAEPGGPPAERLADPGPAGWTLLVGPEGGFEAAELGSLGPMERLGLGPHVLRAETAAVAGAALLQARREIGHGAWD